jgi:transcriptional regulator with XRE-family HTH domain
MKKNPRLEARRKSILKDTAIFIDRSFDIVDRIYEILKLKNLSQKDLADLLGKKESEVSKWMTGSHNFTLKTITRIEEVLGSPIINVYKTKNAQNQPIMFLFEHNYAQITRGKDILIGELHDFEIKPIFQKPTPFLS